MMEAAAAAFAIECKQHRSLGRRRRFPERERKREQRPSLYLYIYREGPYIIIPTLAIVRLSSLSFWFRRARGYEKKSPAAAAFPQL